MKLVYTKWREVTAFLRMIDEPVSSEFTMRISTVWQNRDPLPGRWVWEIEIPVECVT